MAEERVLIRGGEAQIEDRKSRFLAISFPISSEEEAAERLKERRKEYWDATHHCYAYSLGPRHAVCRFSDDREPSGTAGKPILDAILGANVQNVLVIVTRYFGGTLLGTGGLVRAYGAAAKAVLLSSGILDVTDGEEWAVLCPYEADGRLEKRLREMGLTAGKVEFGTDVARHYFLSPEQVSDFVACVAQESSGTALAEKLRNVRYGVLDGEVKLL